MTSQKTTNLLEITQQMKFYQDLVETTQDMIWQCDMEGRYIYLNPAWETIFGYTLDEMIGKKFSDFQNPELAKRDTDEFMQLIQGKNIKNFETIHIGKSGNNIHLVFNARFFRDKHGVILGAQGTAHDITDRKQAEEQLRASEEASRSLFVSSPMGIHQYELQNSDRLVFICANPAADTILGVDNSIFIGQTIEEAFPPLESTEVPKRYREVIKTGTTWQTVQVDYKDDCIRGAFHVVAFKTGSNRMAAMFLDITDRKQAEEALLKSQERFKAIFNSTFQFTGLLTSDGTLIEANKAAIDFTGLAEEEILNKPFWETHWWKGNEARVKQLQNAIRQAVKGDFVRYEVELQGAGSTTAFFDFSLKPVFDSNGKIHLLVPEGRDISDIRRMEEELQRTQKLESLGILAGGIAHDFNNLMAGLYGYLDLAHNFSKDVTVSNFLDNAQSTLNRARSLTQQLLTFAKGGAPIQKVGSLFPSVQEAAQFALSGSNISCTFDIQEDLWQCDFDKNQIAQVVDNIVINAQQAMPMGGTIELTARNVKLTERSYNSLPEGNYTQISIKDNGIGIPKDFITRIFDPFFTTKSLGHGLGLATCYSIVKRHGGIIEVDSLPGQGTTFHIFLPAANETARNSLPHIKAEFTGSGTILIMDDEVVVRETMGKMLETFGYTVKCAINGKEILMLLAEEAKAQHSVTGLILDLTIPGGMGGNEVVKLIRATHPTIPLFVVSGYADDPVMQNPSDYGFTASICKPFTRGELSEMLSKYLVKQP